MVLRESMIMVAAGVVIGLVAAVAASRLLTAILFGLSPTDVWTMAAAIVVDDRGVARRWLPTRATSVARRSDGGAEV